MHDSGLSDKTRDEVRARRKAASCASSRAGSRQVQRCIPKYALLNNKRTRAGRIAPQARHEVNVLAALQHPNCVRYFECFAERGDRLTIITELCEVRCACDAYEEGPACPCGGVLRSKARDEGYSTRAPDTTPIIAGGRPAQPHSAPPGCAADREQHHAHVCATAAGSAACARQGERLQYNTLTMKRVLAITGAWVQRTRSCLLRSPRSRTRMTNATAGHHPPRSQDQQRAMLRRRHHQARRLWHCQDPERARRRCRGAHARRHAILVRALVGQCSAHTWPARARAHARVSSVQARS